jgi:hypothetical protein
VVFVPARYLDFQEKRAASPLVRRSLGGGGIAPQEIVRGASNDVSVVKYVNAMNKITTNIAFEQIVCYNLEAKERNRAA